MRESRAEDRNTGSGKKKAVEDIIFRPFNPEDYPPEQRELIREVNRRAEIANEKYRIERFREEMLLKGFDAGAYLAENNEVVRATGFGIWEFLLDESGHICGLLGNEQYKKIYGIENNNLSAEENLRHLLNGLVRPEDDPTQYDYRYMEVGRIVRFTFPWKHPDKGLIYVESAGAKRISADGSVHFSGYAADVTEAALAEQKQKQELSEAKERAEENNRKLNEQLDIISTVAKAFNVIYYVDMRDYSFIELGAKEWVREVIGRSGDARVSFEVMCKKLVTPDFEEECREFTNMYTLNDRLKDREWITHQFHFRDGAWSEGVFIAANRDAQGRCEHVIWSTRSINEIKEREFAYARELEAARDQAEAASQAKTSFLFNMSHDIRTPMNAIIGFRELLEKNQEDPEKRADYLKKIEDASQILLSIINNVLEMARIEKGTVELDETACTTEQFHEAIYSIFNEMMEKKNIRFTRRVDVEHPYVFCDQIKLQKVYINILGNAYKYTNPGGKVHMQLKELPSDREGYVLYQNIISDTGMGMSEEFLPHLFEEFAREKNTTEAKIEGTGLGMPIVKRLVELMNGTIEVRSKKGKGTSFIVTIPHRIAEKPEKELYADADVDPELFKGKRILLAEDNDMNALIVKEVLGGNGFLIERAEDGVEVCDMYEKAQPGYYDLILMDVQMPNRNGYEATQIIRRLEDPVKAGIPILAMTANAFEEDRRAALEAGMNGHLTKPIRVKDLLRALANILK